MIFDSEMGAERLATIDRDGVIHLSAQHGNGENLLWETADALKILEANKPRQRKHLLMKAREAVERCVQDFTDNMRQMGNVWDRAMMMGGPRLAYSNGMTEPIDMTAPHFITPDASKASRWNPRDLGDFEFLTDADQNTAPFKNSLDNAIDGEYNHTKPSFALTEKEVSEARIVSWKETVDDLYSRAVLEYDKDKVLVRPYGELRKKENRRKGYQAHHVVQNAAMKGTISKKEGMAIYLQGDVFREPGSKHNVVHQFSEIALDRLRKREAMYGIPATMSDINALYCASYEKIGLSEEQIIEQILKPSIEQQKEYGFKADSPIPNMPKKFYVPTGTSQKGGNNNGKKGSGK